MNACSLSGLGWAYNEVSLSAAVAMGTLLRYHWDSECLSQSTWYYSCSLGCIALSPVNFVTIYRDPPTTHYKQSTGTPLHTGYRKDNVLFNWVVFFVPSFSFRAKKNPCSTQCCTLDSV